MFYPSKSSYFNITSDVWNGGEMVTHRKWNGNSMFDTDYEYPITEWQWLDVNWPDSDVLKQLYDQN